MQAEFVAQRAHIGRNKASGGTCYNDDCPEIAKYECRVIICFKNYGCGAMMCKNHRA